MAAVAVWEGSLGVDVLVGLEKRVCNDVGTGVLCGGYDDDGVSSIFPESDRRMMVPSSFTYTPEWSLQHVVLPVPQQKLPSAQCETWV